MLTPVLAHSGQPPAPHDLWGAWNLDPVLLGGFLLAAWAYWRGQTSGPRRPVDRWRARCFTAALAALGLALLSPLDALSGALASAHMVQHLLLILVAAPLLALSAPTSTILRGSPLAVRRATGRSTAARAGPRQPRRPAPPGRRMAAVGRGPLVLARRRPL